MEYRQPFEGYFPITQRYGETDTSDFHTGIDYGLPLGTPVLASEEGTVVYAGWDNSGYGNCAIIKHPDGNGTLYAHLAAPIIVYVGQYVNKSQVIGYSGSTGNSTGPHLHFEARHSWSDYTSHFDPMDLPLHTYVAGAENATTTPPSILKDASALGPHVEVVCPLGAKAWYDDFRKYSVFPQGTDVTYTGKTCQHNGYTYCEVYRPAPRYWVAVNDGDTQILDNSE